MRFMHIFIYFLRLSIIFFQLPFIRHYVGELYLSPSLVSLANLDSIQICEGNIHFETLRALMAVGDFVLRIINNIMIIAHIPYHLF